jgi:hypothetical protein
MRANLADYRDGVVRFPVVGDRVYDSDWEYPTWGTVYESEYPYFRVEWDMDDDAPVSRERVKY